MAPFVRARMPCAAGSKGGAAFAFFIPADGEPMSHREASWWWAEGETFHQSAHLKPTDSDTGWEFGVSVAVITWLVESILLILILTMI